MKPNTPLKVYLFPFQDEVMDEARDIEINLEHKVGKFVKIQLFFDAKWIMISEVEFKSGKQFDLDWQTLQLNRQMSIHAREFVVFVCELRNNAIFKTSIIMPL